MSTDPYQGKRRRRPKPATIPGDFVPRFWEEIDGRTSIKLRIRKLYRRLKEESGADTLAKDELCQRAAFWLVVLHTKEVEAAESGEFDEVLNAKHLKTVFEMLRWLGLDNSAKPKGSTSLKQYVRGNGYAAGKGRSTLGTKDGRRFGNGPKLANKNQKRRKAVALATKRKQG